MVCVQSRISTRVAVLVCSSDASEESVLDRAAVANLLWQAQIPVRRVSPSPVPRSL